MVNQLKANIIIIIISAIITLVLLFGSNLIIQFNNFTEKQITIATFVTSLLIFYFVGFFSGNIKGKNGLANGIITSVLLVAIFLVITIIEKSFDFSHVVRYIIMILTGGLGGIIGVNFKPIIKA